MQSFAPLVSVGVPTYNRPDGLSRTLSSILNQTHHPLEIIVSDNHSLTADVETLMVEVIWRDQRVQYFRQPQNIGMHNNFKFVLDKATGEFFMWAADDDDWDREFSRSS